MKAGVQVRGHPEHIHFNVRRASPSLPNYPAKELEVQAATTKGYHTHSVPAELELELLGGCKYDISQLQILSHESRISSQIDVYVQTDPAYGFECLGFLELDENSRSGYHARELVCIQIGSVGIVQVKLVLHKAHVNEYNPEGLVGLIGINLLGWKSQQVVEEAPREKITANPRNEDQSLEEELLRTIRKLAQEVHARKEKAVESERYDEAMQLKIEEQRLAQEQDRVIFLNKTKAEAVAREDYQQAKDIKRKLEEFRDVWQQGKREPPTSRPSQMVPEKPALEPRANDHGPVEDNERPEHPPSPRLPALKQQPQSQEKPTEPLDPPPPGFWTSPKDQELPTAEELEPHLRNAPSAQLMIRVLGMYSVRCIYSANTSLRMAIFQKLKLQLEDQDLNVEETEAILTAATLALEESSSSKDIFRTGVELVNGILDGIAEELVNTNKSLEQSIIPHLVDALSSSDTAKDASDLFIRLSGIFSIESCLQGLVGKVPKRSTLWRPILSRLLITQHLVERHRDFDANQWGMQILEWMKGCGAFHHASDQVSEAALELTSSLHSCIADGAMVVEFVKATVRQPAVSKYLERFDKHGNNQSKQKAEEPDEDDSCYFCKATDPLFAKSQQALDLHMWRDCPMLGHCPHCNQVIEIENLNDHLLEECSFKSNHVACPRCHEAIAAHLFEKHVDRKACLVAKPKNEANRCPLCHKDIPPFAAGWRQHLMVDKCPANLRNAESVPSL